MTNNKNSNKENLITERVFSNDNKSIESILRLYVKNKIEKVIAESYDSIEIGTTSIDSKEVA